MEQVVAYSCMKSPDVRTPHFSFCERNELQGTIARAIQNHRDTRTQRLALMCCVVLRASVVKSTPRTARHNTITSPCSIEYQMPHREKSPLQAD